MTGASWVTQADRARWQRQAARELAAILGAWGDLPLIMWAVGPVGGLAGSVTGPARPAMSGWCSLPGSGRLRWTK